MPRKPEALFNNHAATTAAPTCCSDLPKPANPALPQTPHPAQQDTPTGYKIGRASNLWDKSLQAFRAIASPYPKNF